MNRHAYKAVTNFSIGDVVVQLVPVGDFEGQRQALDAMLAAADGALKSWVIDYTFDPDQKNGKQEPIEAQIMDGQQRHIATIQVSVPTTSNYDKTMFEKFLTKTLVPAIQKAARSYPSTRVGQQASSTAGNGHLAQDMLSGAIEESVRVQPRQLQTR